MFQCNDSASGQSPAANGLAAADQELNGEQRRAVSLCRQPLLVLAPVGTGKTQVLSLRAAAAIGEGVDPATMLCLSFTNKAAREMRGRLVRMLGSKAAVITTRTFHALCSSILRADAARLGTDSDFIIYDEEDCKEIFWHLWRQRGIHVPTEDQDRFENCLFAAAEQARLSKYNEPAARDAETVFRGALQDAYFKALDRRQDFHFPAMLRDYVSALRQNHALDFADLILGVLLLWEEQPAVLARWQESFCWIQVDEVQDTSRAEYRVLRQLAAGHRQLSFFGDVDQTIYEWRGSAPFEILEQYRRDFGPVEEIVFTKNYRSTQGILRACAAFIAAYGRATTRQIIAQVAEEGEPVSVHGAASAASEAKWIAERITRLRQRQELRFRDIAVLTRTNFTAADLSGHLERLGVPHLQVDQMRFFDRAEIKAAVAHLRVLLNRHDGNSFWRYLQTPPKGIGEAVVHELRQATTQGLKWTDLLDHDSLRDGDPFAALFHALERNGVVVLDVETTGLDTSRDEIVELAAARCGTQGITDRYHAYARPSRPVGASERVHGLSDEFLRGNGREPEAVLGEFQQFARDALIAGHNLGFDLAILRSQMARLGLCEPAGARTQDTLEIARRLYRFNRYSLGSVCKQLGLNAQPTHRAADDVAATVELLLHLAGRLKDGEQYRRQLFLKHGAKFAALAQKLDHWRARMQVERPHELLARVLDESGLAAWYEGRKGEERRVENLKELLRLFTSLDEETLSPLESLLHILNQVALGNGADRQAGEEDRVMLLTVHQAKGMEFDTVFIAGATDSEFPSLRSQREGRLDEEHRLFYVAMSRAKKRLFFTYPQVDHFGRKTLPSRYLHLLPEEAPDRR